jgi:hypothetical protein
MERSWITRMARVRDNHVDLLSSNQVWSSELQLAYENNINTRDEELNL